MPLTTTLAVLWKREFIGKIVIRLEERIKQTVGTNQVNIKAALSKCLKVKRDGTTSDFFDPEEAAFLGVQMLLDNCLNPNTTDQTGKGKAGDKRSRSERSQLLNCKIR